MTYLTQCFSTHLFLSFVIPSLFIIYFCSPFSSIFSDAPTCYEIILIASTRVLARLRARFASIVFLLPSALLKLASAISRVC
ncbi:hypothetical protein RIF29_45378 [Crotalaria pallida]|uniref:Uncharacterized protein n=1 Tax=Crotalaria pallida TaxID=3830 RepID=A0AAN9DWW6_CROPI